MRDLSRIAASYPIVAYVIESGRLGVYVLYPNKVKCECSSVSTLQFESV